MGQFNELVAGKPQAPAGLEGRIWQPLGLPATALPNTGASANVIITPLTKFKGQRLVLPRALAALVNITSMTVQGIPQLASGDPLPGDAFAPDAVLTDLGDFADCPPQGQIVIGMAVNDATAHTASGAFFGWAAPRS